MYANHADASKWYATEKCLEMPWPRMGQAPMNCLLGLRNAETDISTTSLDIGTYLS